MRILFVLALLSLAALPALALDELNGFLTIEDSAVWLTGHSPENAPRSDRVRIKDGPCPRPALSIAREYGSENRVILRGVRDGGAFAIDDCEPAFVPFVPEPERVTRVKLNGDVLEIVVRVNPCIPREKLHVKLSPYMNTAPRQASISVQAPDRFQDVCSGDEVGHTFSVDLRAHYPATPFVFTVRGARCEPAHRVTWNMGR